jgi:hypothetical protein
LRDRFGVVIDNVMNLDEMPGLGWVNSVLA